MQCSLTDAGSHSPILAPVFIAMCFSTPWAQVKKHGCVTPIQGWEYLVEEWQKGSTVGEEVGREMVKAIGLCP